MSSIDKLLIRGIRSFSPYNENVIEFYTPLTIIVGHNGAGKTTIIEGLKYSTTGDLPPNAKGGAFVHDPKVSREVEVKGQIKLKFKNVRGQTMVCTRSLQSTQKRTKLEQKSLESLLATTDPNTGEQVSISSRCAEMDAEIPLQLGVSRAVLENVLFCHQEESFWPLSEPSVLKKKFDDIFSATRYTKALDTLKAIRKDLTAELKLEQQKLEFLKSDLDKATKLELEIEKAEKLILEGQSKITNIENQMISVNESIQKLSKELQNLTGLQNEMERLEHDLCLARQGKDDLENGITIMMESDEDLLKILDQHTQRNTSDESALNNLRAEKLQIEVRITETSKALTIKSTELGVMEAEEGRIDDKRLLRCEKIYSLCRLLSIPEGDGDDDIQAMYISTNEAIRQKQLEYENCVRSIRSLEDQGNQKLQSLQGKLTSITEVKKMKRRVIDESQIKLASIIDQISDIKSARDQIDELEFRLLDEESNLNQTKTFVDVANYDDRLSVLTKRRKEIDYEINRLNAQIASSTKSSEIRAKIEVKRAEFERRSEMINKIYSEVKNDISISSGGLDIPIEEVERESERLWRQKERQLRALQERHDKANQASSISKSKLEHAKSLISKKEFELQDKIRKVEQVCGKENFNIFYEETDAEYNRLTNNISRTLSGKTTYESFIQQFGQNHKCPLCERKFDSKMDEELFSRRLSNFITTLPSQALELEGSKRTIEARLNALKNLRTINDDIDRLRSVELPELMQEIELISDEANKAQTLLDDTNSELSAMILEEKKLAVLKRRCEEIGKFLREQDQISVDIENIEANLRLSGVELVNVSQIQSDLSQLQTEGERVQKEYDQISSEMKNRQKDLQIREGRFRDVKEQLLKIQLKQSESNRLEQSKTELEETISSLSKETAQLDSDLTRLNQEISILQKKLDEQKTINSIEEQRVKRSLDNALQSLQEFKMMNDEICLLESKCNSVIITSLKLEVDEIHVKLLGLQRELDQTNDKIAIFSKASSEAIVQERNVRDNLRYREFTKRIKTIEEDINRMKVVLGGFDRSSATNQLRRHELRHSELLGERSGIFGEIRQLQEQAQRLNADISTDYKNVEETYRQQFIRYSATNTAIEDLEKYSKALDQAIMKFHTCKMAEVNRIIKEIWTATYQGADIDTIEIRADHESASGVSGRSYNYRVVMVKGDTDLDMRGRSSAGQRVLASLIIRLALAETFGQQCGVLALDEPTTNLDRDNIESLANSLAEIIKVRGSQGNFQLIIITHDEEFVELLGRHECADYYWRVFKDENQYSTIERQSFQGF